MITTNEFGSIPAHAIVRVSFESVPEANQEVNRALVGLAQGNSGDGAFNKTSTSCYACSNSDDRKVRNNLRNLFRVIIDNWAALDSASIIITRDKNA
jgi:hypothetical protein